MSAFGMMVQNLTQAVENKANGVEITEPKEPTKADLARDIFDRLYGQPGIRRKDILDAFCNEAGLTKNGANTYYQNIKKAKGLVKDHDHA